MKKILPYFFVTIALCLSLNIGLTQEEIDPDTTPTTSNTLIDLHLGYAWSAGDLKNRFGSKNYAGLGISKITSRNFTFGVKGSYFFGRNVKEDVLASLRNDQGVVLGVDGQEAIVRFRERGVNFNVNAGKLFPFKEGSKSGLKITVGVGMMQHWVRIQDETRTIPQIIGNYLYGYDKKTRGFSLNQFIGYQNLSADKRLNFYVGVDIYEGFTKNIRPFNFNTQQEETESRLDVMVGLKVGFIIPFYHVNNPEEIFY